MKVLAHFWTCSISNQHHYNMDAMPIEQNVFINAYIISNFELKRFSLLFSLVYLVLINVSSVTHPHYQKRF